MRLAISSQDQNKIMGLSQHLQSLNIINEVEASTTQDWGSPDYGAIIYHLWIREEEEFSKASEIANAYFEDPTQPQFSRHEQSAPPLPAAKLQVRRISSQKKRAVDPAKLPWSSQPLGSITLYLFALCCLIFLTSELSTPVIEVKIAAELPAIPLYASETTKELLFDYPHAFEIIDHLVSAYGIEELQNLNKLSAGGAALLQQFRDTPYWKGGYPLLVAYLRSPEAFQYPASPLFEKIRQGELWRLISPALMHENIFHLLFNMVLLIMLGKQLEQRMGSIRYLLFFLLAAATTNIFQYLTGGGSFLGFSGVICAMLTFIWMRQRRTPWEGYQLESSSLAFMLFFLFTMLALQLLSFYSEITYGKPFGPPIANSAHMTGLAIGVLFGRLNFFTWR